MCVGWCLYFPLPYAFETLNDIHTFESDGETKWLPGAESLSLPSWCHVSFPGAGYVRLVLYRITLPNACFRWQSAFWRVLPRLIAGDPRGWGGFPPEIISVAVFTASSCFWGGAWWLSAVRLYFPTRGAPGPSRWWGRADAGISASLSALTSDRCHRLLWALCGLPIGRREKNFSQSACVLNLLSCNHGFAAFHRDEAAFKCWYNFWFVAEPRKIRKAWGCFVSCKSSWICVTLCRKWQPTPGFLPGESRGQRSLAGYRPEGRRVGHDWSNSAQHSRKV